MKELSKKYLLNVLGILVIVLIIAYALRNSSSNSRRMTTFDERIQVVLDVNWPGMMTWIAQKPDALFRSVIEAVTQESKSVPDLDVFFVVQQKLHERNVPLSRYFGDKGETNSAIDKKLRSLAENAVEIDSVVIRSRLSQYGVTNLSFVKQNQNRFVAEFQIPPPGKFIKREIRDLLRGRGLLEFRALLNPAAAYGIVSSVDSILFAAGRSPLIDSSIDPHERLDVQEDLETYSPLSGYRNECSYVFLQRSHSQHLPQKVNIDSLINHSEGMQSYNLPFDISERSILIGEFAKIHPLLSLAFFSPRQFPGELIVPEEYKEAITDLLNSPEAQSVIPRDVAFLWGGHVAYFRAGKRYFPLYAVSTSTIQMNGRIVKSSGGIEPDSGKPSVDMEVNQDGKQSCARFTGDLIGHRFAIVLDSVVFAAPYVSEKIEGGKVTIAGLTNLEEARLLQIILMSENLAAPLDVVSVEAIIHNQ